MSDENDPAANIERLYAGLLMRPDVALLSDLESLPPLPPERGRTWETDSPWRAAELLVAFSGVAAERGNRAMVRLVLDRMCLGDPGEMMRGVRHAFEEAVQGDWPALARIYEDACHSPYPGARYWAVQYLANVRQCSSLPTVLQLLADPVCEVAEEACATAALLASICPGTRATTLEALRAAAQRSDIRHAVDNAVRGITMDA